MHPLTRSRPVRLALVTASALIALIPAISAQASAPVSLTVAARGTSRPTLAQLPNVLASGAAARAPLTIALSQPVSGTALRAAILAASAAQRAEGAHGLAVRVLLHPTRGQLDSAPGATIVIDQRPGAPRLALAASSRGRVQVTIAGSGADLLTAARLLSVPAIHAFTTPAATVPAGLVAPVTHDPAPASVALAPGSVSGRGPLTLRTQFTLPLDRQLVGDTAVRIVSAYDSPAGGRVSARLQGGVLGATDVPAKGPLRAVVKSKLSDDPALTGDTLPGWWAHPGANQVTVSATPQRAGASGTLQVLPTSRVSLQTSPRAAALQLGLWPFPIYNDHAWSHATVLVASMPDATTLAALIGALANTERITGIPADPAVALGNPSTQQASGNLIIAGAAAHSAAAGQLSALRGLHATQPALPGMLEEVRLPSGAVALLAGGARALSALGPDYALGSVSGRAALVDGLGRAHALAAGEPIRTFASPRLPWLAPAAFLALLVLGWIAVRITRAQRRMATMPAFEPAERGGGS